MPDPFRLRVMKAITSQIKTVTPGNGYMHDLADYVNDAGQPAARVFRGRDMFSAVDQLPLVSVLEDFRDKEQLNASAGKTYRTGPWRLLIQGFAHDDMDNPTDPAYVMCAEVVKAIVLAKKEKNNILGLGNRMPCVTEMEIGQPVVRPADGQISDAAYFYLPITITVVEDLENPFA